MIVQEVNTLESGLDTPEYHSRLSPYIKEISIKCKECGGSLFYSRIMENYYCPICDSRTERKQRRINYMLDAWKEETKRHGLTDSEVKRDLERILMREKLSRERGETIDNTRY